MKAITIKQPWASLIVSGLKDIENRSWKTNFRGRVLIHAGETVSKNGWREMNQRQIDVAASTKMMGAIFNELPFGAIIGSVEIVGCVQNHPSIWAEKGAWNWVLANPVMFPEPITGVKGKLSFWNYDCGERTGQKPDKLNIITYDEDRRRHKMAIDKDDIESD